MTTATKNCRNISTINVPIDELILTPATCASLVNEVMKNLLYQRSQIPYPYAWLKSIVKKKRQILEDSEKTKSKNFTLIRHFQVVSAAYDGTENIMSSLTKAFSSYGNYLKEVVFVIGVTPFAPSEIFTIKVSSVSLGHVESNHASENIKKQPKILRSIFFENAWMSLNEHILPCSNMYVFLKLHTKSIGNDSLFVPTKPLSIHPGAKHTIIHLDYTETDDFFCCDKLKVFKDLNDIQTPTRTQESTLVQNEENEEVWLQSRTLVKGFKDCFINKVSASELW